MTINQVQPLARGAGPQLHDAPDATLVSRAADGDVDAFRILVGRYYPAMRAYAGRIVGRTADADDVVQEAFIAAWAHLGELSDGVAVQGWLFRIVSRKAFDLLRSRREYTDLKEVTLIPSEYAGPETVVTGDRFAYGLRAALDRLPVPQGQVWLLREIAGYSYQEIADDTDLTVSTIRGLLARARRALTEQMGEWR